MILQSFIGKKKKKSENQNQNAHSHQRASAYFQLPLKPNECLEKQCVISETVMDFYSSM